MTTLDMSAAAPPSENPEQWAQFQVGCGSILTVPVAAVFRNSVLKMVWQHRLDSPVDRPILVDDERRTFESLLRHLEGAPVDLSQRDFVDMITMLRCAHKYQCYTFATDILKQLVTDCSADNVLHLYCVLAVLPELPPNGDPQAPSAPPVHPLQHVDPEQAEFSSLLLHAFQLCLQVVDGWSVEVLNSDALLSLSGEMLMGLLQRDTLHARESEIGAAVLRWLRHYTVSFSMDQQRRRLLVLGTVRLLVMSARDLKRLDLRRLGILCSDELAAVLQHVHHGTAALPEQLAVYRQYWLQRRTGSGSQHPVRLLVSRLIARTRGPSLGPVESHHTAQQRHHQQQKKHKRADKIKMALATGASLIFD